MVAVGGDGLVRDVAEGVVAAGPASVMAIVPAGRGNDLARALGCPTGAGALAEVLLHGQARALDVIDLDGTIVPGNVYCGIDSVANAMHQHQSVDAPVRCCTGWRRCRRS